MTKQLRYMDSIVEAAGRMITDKETPIHLPIAIQDIEDEPVSYTHLTLPTI